MSSYRTKAQEISNYYQHPGGRTKGNSATHAHRTAGVKKLNLETISNVMNKCSLESPDESLQQSNISSCSPKPSPSSSSYSPTCSPAPILLNNNTQQGAQRKTGGGGGGSSLVNNYQHHPLLHAVDGDELRDSKSGGDPTPSPPSPATSSSNALPMFDRCRKVGGGGGGGGGTTATTTNQPNGLNGEVGHEKTTTNKSSNLDDNSTQLGVEPIPPARRLRTPTKGVTATIATTSITTPSLVASGSNSTSTSTTISVTPGDGGGGNNASDSNSSSTTATASTMAAATPAPPNFPHSSASSHDSKSPGVQAPPNQVLNLANIIGNQPLAEVLITLKEQNKLLVREIEDLRIKLEDAEGDLKLVRCQMRTISKEVNTVTIETNRERLLMDDSLLSQLHYEKERARLLERDVQSLLAEKEKLLVSKTDLQLKNDRLNGHLVTVLRSMTMEQRQHYQQQAGDPGDNNTLLYDIDRLTLENRYLKEKINTEEDDRRLLLDSLAKYQSLLDERQGKEQGAGKYYAARGHGTRQGQQLAAAATRLANTNGGEEGRAELMDDIEIDPNELPSGGRHSSKGGTQREIQRLIASDSIDSMEVSKDNQVYLYNLLVGLYEDTTPRAGHHSTSPYRSSPSPYHHRHQHHYHHQQQQASTSTSYRASSGNATSPRHRLSHRSPDDHLLLLLDGRLTPSTNEPGERPGSSTLKGTSTEDEGAMDEEDEEDETEDTSTGLSTPSTNARHSLSIERHLQALQDDALADHDLTPVRASPPPPQPPLTINRHRSPSSPRRPLYHHSGGGATTTTPTASTHLNMSSPTPTTSSPYSSHKTSSNTGLY